MTHTRISVKASPHTSGAICVGLQYLCECIGIWICKSVYVVIELFSKIMVPTCTNFCAHIQTRCADEKTKAVQKIVRQDAFKIIQYKCIQQNNQSRLGQCALKNFGHIWVWICVHKLLYTDVFEQNTHKVRCTNIRIIVFDPHMLNLHTYVCVYAIMHAFCM